MKLLLITVLFSTLVFSQDTAPVQSAGTGTTSNTSPSNTSPEACPPGSPQVACFAEPCSVSTCPKHANAVCHNNYCGGCNAIWKVGGDDVTDSCHDTRPVTQTLPPVREPVDCGDTKCYNGQTCCNPSCGYCVDPNGACTQELCTNRQCCDWATRPGLLQGVASAHDYSCCNGVWKENTGGNVPCGSTDPLTHRCKVPECRPGDRWAEDCNTCECDAQGNKACTKKACPPNTCHRDGVAGDSWTDREKCVLCKCRDSAVNRWECFMRQDCRPLEEVVRHFVRVRGVRITPAQFDAIVEKFRMHVDIISRDLKDGRYDIVVSIKDLRAGGKPDDNAYNDLRDYLSSKINSDPAQDTEPVQVQRMGTSSPGGSSAAAHLAVSGVVLALLIVLL